MYSFIYLTRLWILRLEVIMKIFAVVFFFYFMQQRTQCLPQTSSTINKIPKLVLLDRDGVINEDVGYPGVLNASQLTLTPHAGQAIGKLKRAGCKIAIITNQSCVGKKLITEDKLVNEIHTAMKVLLTREDPEATIDHIFYCTSLKERGDYRMKPNPGMIQEACEMFHVEPNDCIMIGDTLTDLKAAQLANVSLRILVETGYGYGIMNGLKAPSCGSLSLMITFVKT